MSSVIPDGKNRITQQKIYKGKSGCNGLRLFKKFTVVTNEVNPVGVNENFQREGVFDI